MSTTMRSLAIRALHRHFAAAEERTRTLSAIPDSEWPRRQLDALQQVWTDAVADVPYYAEMVASKRAPMALRNWDDVRAVPVLTREHLQRQPDAFIRRSGPPATFLKTAGSTGTPIAVGMNQAERDLMRIVKVSAW